jgi:hypothetical protein
MYLSSPAGRRRSRANRWYARGLGLLADAARIAIALVRASGHGDRRFVHASGTVAWTLPVAQTSHPASIKGHSMNSSAANDRANARSAVLEALARLRALFPLEQRLQSVAPAVRAAYVDVLQSWLHAGRAPKSIILAETLDELVRLDAIVPAGDGLGCYPFSAHDTGIMVALPAGAVNAMCAIDALAVARVAGEAVEIHATCEACGTAVSCEVEENGGLDHDQPDPARVFWQSACTTHGSCSQGLCRNIRFLCGACASPGPGDVYTLPQATAIANAFFAFQSRLLRPQPEAAP